MKLVISRQGQATASKTAGYCECGPLRGKYRFSLPNYSSHWHPQQKLLTGFVSGIVDIIKILVLVAYSLNPLIHCRERICILMSSTISWKWGTRRIIKRNLIAATVSNLCLLVEMTLKYCKSNWNYIYNINYRNIFFIFIRSPDVLPYRIENLHQSEHTL